MTERYRLAIGERTPEGADPFFPTRVERMFHGVKGLVSFYKSLEVKDL